MDNNILAQVLELYGLNKAEFAELSGVPYKTLEGWQKNGASSQGVLLLKKYIELKELEAKYEKQLEEYKKKAEKYDVIKAALS